MVYLENRRYLPESSPLRKDSTGFPSSQAEQRKIPDARTFAELKQLHAAYDQVSKR